MHIFTRTSPIQYKIERPLESSKSDRISLKELETSYPDGSLGTSYYTRINKGIADSIFESRTSPLFVRYTYHLCYTLSILRTSSVGYPLMQR